MPTHSEIQFVTRYARDKAFKRFGISEDSPREEKLGYCARFATLLAREYERHLPVQAYIQAGALDLRGHERPASFAEAQKNKLTHYWVVLDTSPEIYCEIAAACPEWNSGDIRVSKSLPPRYLPLGDRYRPHELTDAADPPDSLLLWDAVNTARDTVLSDHNLREAYSDRLEGHCHDLAEVLLRELAPRWKSDDPNFGNGRVDCYIMFGGLEQPDGCSRQEIEPHDHCWVEATTVSGDRYICDVWSWKDTAKGQPLLTSVLPENYARTFDGRIPLAEVVESDDWVRFYT